MSKKLKEVDHSTEEKILHAAREVFMSKGYDATKTRDIAEKAGINLALLNYYFRSKEKLFNKIMVENAQRLFGTLFPIVNDEHTTLEEKFMQLASHYMDMLLQFPEMPIFVFSELRKHAPQFMENAPKFEFFRNVNIYKQIQERRPDLNPVHVVMSGAGMIIFPFMVFPAFEAMGVVNKENFDVMMNERRKLIPIWMKSILDSKL